MTKKAIMFLLLILRIQYQTLIQEVEKPLDGG
jgi:hypothetical protein